MNQAEYLCHSSGPWKKHKYFQKIGDGANAVYRYAKNKGKKVSVDDDSVVGKSEFEKKNKDYRTNTKELWDTNPHALQEESKSYSDASTIAANRAKTLRGAAAVEDPYTGKWMTDKEKNDNASYEARRSHKYYREAERLGRRSAEEKAKRMDKENKVANAVDDVSKKIKKKLKHDDFSSTAITGQQLIDNILGR